MSEFFIKKPAELLEIEQVVNELMEDLTHPLNNNRHPDHRNCVQAFNLKRAVGHCLWLSRQP
jgi:LmbE family N-acetylglucosaminyl deacetylase